jgi:large subunit ribosomal protein L15
MRRWARFPGAPTVAESERNTMPLRLDDLRPNEGSNHARKRVGRGHGSGHGKTSGRGTKGQNSRAGGGVRPGFEGGQLPIQQALPYKRGFTNIYKTPWEIVNLGDIAERGMTGEITPETLHARGVIRGLEFPVKILADGEVTGALTVRAHAFSAAAKERIAAVGGTAEVLERTDRWVSARPRSRRLPLNAEMKGERVGKVGGPRRRSAALAEGER